MNWKHTVDYESANRIKLLLLIIIVMFAGLIAQLAYLQFEKHDIYDKAIMNEITSVWTEEGLRGEITDRNGVVLATNIPVYNLIIDPSLVIERLEDDAESEKEPDEDGTIHFTYEYVNDELGYSYYGDDFEEFICSFLESVFECDSETIDEVREVIEKNRAKDEDDRSKYYKVLDEMSDEAKKFLDEFPDEYDLYPIVYAETEYKRYYPKGTLACHVLGFCNSEGEGVYGLEKTYNDELMGSSGRTVVARDKTSAKNSLPFTYSVKIDAENGYTLVTTLDVNIQYELEQQLEETYNESSPRERVCGIVMDTENAEILAMAVYPPFDPNDPNTLSEEEQAAFDAKAIAENLIEGTEEYNSALSEAIYSRWMNKCVSETYEPGSTFKIVTTSMGYEEQLVEDDDLFYCAGYYYVENWGNVSCAVYPGEHGWVTFRYGLQQSCNPTLMQLADRIGISKFYSYFKLFGYTGITGIDLPTESYTLYADEDSFDYISMMVYSFGQTFSTTPIQQIRAINAIANGGYLLVPHVMLELKASDGTVVQSSEREVVRQVISTDVCEHITEILEEGVNTDGAAKNAYVKGYRVAAKTGTSEKMSKIATVKANNGGTISEEERLKLMIGSTVAYAPADDPQVIALIMVDEPQTAGPYGGTVAAPYISNLLSYTLPYLGFDGVLTEDELVTVNNYVGVTLENAESELYWMSFDYEIVGDGEYVTAQVPEVGSRISSDSGLLVLYTGDATVANSVEVPNLLGMNAFNANKLAVDSGLNVTCNGANGQTATVVEQTPSAGTYVPRGTIITIEVRHLDGND